MTPEQKREIEAAAKLWVRDINEMSPIKWATCCMTIGEVAFELGARHQDAVAYARGFKDGLAKALGIAERELSYRQHLDEHAPLHRTNHPITACKEIISAIKVWIADRERALLPSPGETAKGEG